MKKINAFKRIIYLRSLEITMMQRVHAPEKRSCCPSRQKESGQFAPRGFSRRGEDNELDGRRQASPYSDFSFADIPLFPQVQAKPEPNRTGMPDRLKAGIETLSGIDMSDVRVHANSDKPARLNALAFTQGNHIYMGPGQERHLAHEAWHAVQQKQGRVRATGEMKGLGINNNSSLEHEAGMIGAKAAQFSPDREDEPQQEKYGEAVTQNAEGASDNKGLQEDSKTKTECISRMSMDEVKTDYDFLKPPQLNVHGCGQDNCIHIRSVQEKHLPYDAGHVMLKRALGAAINRRRRETSNSEPIAQMMKSSATVEAEIISDGNHKTSIEITEMGSSGSEQQPKAILNALNQTRFIVEGNAKKYNYIGEMVNGSKPGQCAEPHAVANAIKNVYKGSVQEGFDPEESRIRINKITVHKAFHEGKHKDTADSYPKYYGDDPGKHWILGIARRCPTCASWIDGNEFGGFEDAEVMGLHGGTDLLLKIKRGVQDAGYLEFSEQQEENEKRKRTQGITNIKKLATTWGRNFRNGRVTLDTMVENANRWIIKNAETNYMTVPQAIQAFNDAAVDVSFLSKEQIAKFIIGITEHFLNEV
jgi:hypothetical protein